MPIYQKMNEITISQLFKPNRKSWGPVIQFEFFEGGTKMKICSEITQPLKGQYNSITGLFYLWVWHHVTYGQAFGDIHSQVMCSRQSGDKL